VAKILVHSSVRSISEQHVRGSEIEEFSSSILAVPSPADRVSRVPREVPSRKFQEELLVAARAPDSVVRAASR
jgi:Trm5-related predicted tRNA methylase